MKKTSFLILAILLSGTWLTKPAFAQDAQNFSFESFSADYALTHDSQNASHLKVTETLVANFPLTDQNHGILRAIPEKYKGHTLSLHVDSVRDQQGTAYPYTAADQNDNKVLKIGDPNVFVHDRKVYVITYEMQDVISFYNDHDEFFWDINGDQWPQTFGTVTAIIHMPDDLGAAMQSRKLCYAGLSGSLSQNCSVTTVTNEGRTAVTATANTIGPNQTLSVVLGFKPGTFQLSQAAKNDLQKQKIERLVAFILGAGLPLVCLAYLFNRWRKVGDDPKGRGVIIPQYEPPKGFDVMSSDYILKEKLRSVAISAAIIEKAVTGFITIYEIPKTGLFSSKDYVLEIKSTPPDLSVGAKEVLGAIFNNDMPAGTKVSLNDIKKNMGRELQINKALKKTDKDMAQSLADDGYFAANPKKIKQKYSIIGGFLFIAAFFIGQSAFSAHLTVLVGAAVGLGISAFITFGFSLIMPARTETGVAVHDSLLGLKDYIKLAEADRLRFLQSPQGAEKVSDANAFNPHDPAQKVKLFEKLLPYAMLFGLEKDWAKQFNDIYTTPPGWYQGGNWSAFNAGYLVGSLNSFNQASSQSFAPPSSSGSGFGGGGAGGGGGGGGGGGW